MGAVAFGITEFKVLDVLESADGRIQKIRLQKCGSYKVSRILISFIFSKLITQTQGLAAQP